MRILLITDYRLLITFLLVVYCLLLIAPLPADAALVPCGPTNRQTTENVSGCRLKDIFGLLVGIYNFLLGMAAIVAMIAIVVSGILMLIYHWFENPEAVLQGAKLTLTRAIFGLIIVVVAYVIVYTLLRLLGLEEQRILEYFQGSFFGG